MKVIGKTLGGAVILEIDQQDAGALIRLAEALVDSAPVVVAPAPPPVPEPKPPRAYVKRSAPAAFPGGPVAKPVDKQVPAGGRASTVTTKQRPCAVCNRLYVPSGNAQRICPICKQGRLDQIKSLAEKED